MVNEKKIRSAKWDNLRFFLILCVVAGHLYSSYKTSNDMVNGMILFIYSFHMPAFLFVSGLFAKKAIDEKRYDKVFSLLVLFLVVKYSRWLMNIILNQSYRFFYTKMPDVSWYAFALLVYYLFTMWIRKYDPRYMMIFAVIVSCVSGYASGLGTKFAMTRVLAFYPFFLAGYYLKTEDILKVTEKKAVKIGSAALMIFLAVLAFTKTEELNWLLKLFKGRNSYKALKDYMEIGGLIRFAWIIVAMLIIFALISLTPSFKSVISKWGSRTMQVYAFHNLLVDLFYEHFDKFTWFETASSAATVAALFVVAVLITAVLSIKPIEIIMKKIIYPKKRVE